MALSRFVFKEDSGRVMSGVVNVSWDPDRF